MDDDIGRFESEVSSGLWTEAGSIQAGPMLSDYPGDLWGVRDDRSDFAPGWDALAGQYGDGIHIASDGSINGTFGGCIVSGQPITGTDGASGLRVATVTLMSCDASGEYHAVMDIPANDQEPTLLISGTGGGWRIGRVQ
ncbi:hypothetical protein HXX25_06530 [Hyphobacterium sp. CCMP332]|uniref:hypothetical protein n=1 Tax=Hyphobacterium sp. CCMP332 TaxID=2749086 RepID=UPI001650BBE7|nr:hypothetical protein [Hyphobacterium sp. CCMP332]QNL19013.1 hypothetical protein HXX25_06530 [Hyphobacterium sp. CCMP332]